MSSSLQALNHQFRISNFRVFSFGFIYFKNTNRLRKEGGNIRPIPGDPGVRGWGSTHNSKGK